MKSFEPGFLDKQPISQNLLRTIRLLGEYKGKEDVFKEQSPQVLEKLCQAALIQSTESSNRIEGVTAPHDRIVKLVQNKVKPTNRSEQEIAGYRDVLSTIHTNHSNMKFSVNLVRQLHRDLLKFCNERGGNWKTTQNEIEQTGPDGKFVRFVPVEPHLTEAAMQELHERFQKVLYSNEAEPLLLIAMYVLDFLCIHPFRDGNGRMARLLSLLLLYQSGYQVGRYISLENIVEKTKEGYYETLYASSQKWHEGEHPLKPWWEYFLGVMLVEAYREFEQRAGTFTTSRGAKSQMILDAIEQIRGDFKVADIQRICPGVGVDLIRLRLSEYRKAGKLEVSGRGPSAVWRKKT